MRRYREWVAEVVTNRHRPPENWIVVTEEAAGQAERAEATVRKKQEAEWTAWIHGGPCDGLGRQHRFVRSQTGWIPCKAVRGVTADIDELDDHDVDEEDLRLMAVPPDQPAQPPSAQISVEAEANAWASHWNAVDDEVVIRWPTDPGPQMTQFVVQQLLMAAMTFPEATGLGWDNLHPRALARLTSSLLRRLVTVILAAERLGRWPSSIALVLIALLPKPDGGLRPIGLMPMLVRLWSRVRRSVAVQWELANARPYFYGGPRRGALVAAWRQAFRADAARAASAQYA